MTYLGLMTKTADDYAGQIAELSALATGDSPAEVQQLLSEGLALYLEDNTDTVPVAQTLRDLPADVQETYGGLEDVQEVLLEPALMNPVNGELLRAIEARGLSYREIAKRMGTGHAAISRLVDPFCWGHSLPTLRRLAEVLGLKVEVKLLAA
jgi:antitoxin HicB